MNAEQKPGAVAVPPPPTVTPGDPFGLASAVLAAARALAADPTLGAIVIASGTDELTSPAVCADGAGGNLTGACSLGPSGARGHAIVVHTDAANHVVGVDTINPSPGYFGSGLALTANGPHAVAALSQHQAQTPPRQSNVGLAVIPNVVTVSGGGSARQVPDPSGQKFVNCRPGDTWYPWLQTAGQIGLISGHNDGTVDLALGPTAKLVINALRWAAGQAPL